MIPPATHTPLPVTTFRAEEGYATFYLESDFADGSSRLEAAPVGTYLFVAGVSFEQSTSELPSFQGLGSKTRNLRAPEATGSTLTISALYTQEGLDPDWLNAGHPPLRCYLDWVDSTVAYPAKGDVLTPMNDKVQTLIVTDLVCVSKKLGANDNASVSYTITFNGGEAFAVANDTMDF